MKPAHQAWQTLLAHDFQTLVQAARREQQLVRHLCLFYESEELADCSFVGLACRITVDEGHLAWMKATPNGMHLPVNANITCMSICLASFPHFGMLTQGAKCMLHLQTQIVCRILQKVGHPMHPSALRLLALGIQVLE
jgi:hypothetical protein